MRQILRFAPIAALCLALSACFVSETPLIPPEDAAFPASRLVITSKDDDEPQTIERDEDTYRFGPPNQQGQYARLRLKAVGDDMYVAALWAPDDPGGKESGVLYAVLVADRAANEVASYAAMKPRDFAAVPGLRPCDSDVCIDDLDAYVAYVKGRIATGIPPDQTYRIVEME